MAKGVTVDFNANVARFTKSTDKAIGDLNRFERKTKSTSQKVEASLTNMAKQGAKLGAVAAAATLAFSVIKTTEFNKSISDLAAITGAAGSDLDFLRKKSLEFGATTTLTASQAADAFKLIASAKPDLLANADALAAVTKEAITLSEAAGIDLSAAASGLGNSLNQFNASAEESSRFINVLAAGSKFGASSIEEINAAMVNVGGTAASVGLSFEETNAALQIMAANGIKSAEAGTGLRSVLLNLEKQANTKFRPSVVGMAKAFDNLKKANLTTVEKMSLFGKLMFNQGNTLVENSGKMATLTQTLTGTATAYEQADIRVNNLDGDIKKLNSAIEAQAIVLGSKLDFSLRVVTRGFTDFLALEEQSGDAMRSAEKDAEDLGLMIAGLADIAGNAAKGIALPFNVLGNAIGAAAASIEAVLDGNFAGVAAINAAARKDNDDLYDDLTNPANTRRFVLEAEKMIAAAEARRNALKAEDPAKLDVIPPGGGGGSLDDLQTDAEKKKTRLAAEALAKELAAQQDAAQKAFDQLTESLLNEEEALALSWARRQAIVVDAEERGLVTAAEANTTLLELETEHFKKLADLQEEKVSEMDQFAATMAENMQNSFADFLFDPFDQGLGGMVDGFTVMLRKLAAEAAAAQLAKSLFGEGGSDLGELFSSIAGSVLGGARAKGGPVDAGVPYLVGEEGPEIVVPKAAGNVVPNHAMGGSTIINKVTVSAPNGKLDNQSLSQLQAKLTQATQAGMRNL